MASLSVSVIIPNLHSPVIGAVLAALRQQSLPPCEVLVVGQDRHGQVRSDELVRFVETPQPISAASARNLGALLAQGELLLFLDADCVADPGLVAAHVAAHHAAEIAVCGAVAPGTPDFWARCDHLSSYTFYLPDAPAGQRPYLLSGNSSLPAHIFARVGGFDESFRGAAGEDVEFSLRLRQSGASLVFAPAALVWHRSPRLTMGSALGHLANYGAVTAGISRRQAAPSLGYRLASRQPWLLLLGFPLVGPLKLLWLLLRHPFLWAYWALLPGMALQYAAWCWGFAVALCRQQAAGLSAAGVPPQPGMYR